MKVLWITNTPANGEKYLKTIIQGGGWMKSLDKRVNKKVDLNISFYYPQNVGSFSYSGTKYYPVFKRDKKIFRLINKKPVSNNDLNKFLNIIEIVKPDIIHVHGTEGPIGIIIEKTPIPVVYSIQGNIIVYYHKFLSGIPKKYLNVSNKYFFYKPFKSYYKFFNSLRHIERSIFNKGKYFIGRTDWDKRLTTVLSNKAKYFHNDEILRDGFYKNKWQRKKEGKFIIFTTNSNSFFKGFETICQTVSILNEKKYFEFEWWVAGISINDTIVKVVKKMLSNSFPQKNLVLLGSLSEKDLIDNILQSNLYIMPSHIENSPNNLCEAMILGMPCIATCAGGTSSLLSDRKEGILIQDGDPWAMAGAIIEMYNNYELAIEYGKNARKRALERHDPDKIVNELVKIYKEIIYENKK